jgi:serine protease Do
VAVRLPAAARLAGRDAPDGTRVVVAGFPNGGRQTVGSGEVVEYARLRSPVDASPVMRLTAPVVPGNSGGAVLDERGELVGVVFGVETETGYGLAIPASAVDELLSGGGRAPAASECP